MNQIPIKSTCCACGGEGRLSTGRTFVLAGREHPPLSKCVACDGKGTLLIWINVRQFDMRLHAIEAEE